MKYSHILLLLIVLTGCKKAYDPQPKTPLIKYKDIEYNNYIAVNVRDSIIVSYPTGYHYSDSTICLVLDRDYFLGDCCFGTAVTGVLLNVLKVDWYNFLQNVIYKDSLFIKETWKDHVLDFSPYEEIWLSIDYEIPDTSIINESIRNGTLSNFFERVY